MLKGKTILLGVTGSIAAYKIAGLASALVKAGASVHVLMTENAVNFINPITFETLTGHKCLVDTFDRNFEFSVEHVSLAKAADLFLVAPASANVIGKLAHGIADDMLTTTFMACTCPKLVSPAMNTRMYENNILQDNLKTLGHYGIEVIRPADGYLACGDTRESIDPVRYITNHSTGKMGYAIAKAAAYRGAEVTLVTGPVALKPPLFVNTVPVESAEEMYEAVTAAAEAQDIIIKAAAVADYRPSQTAEDKIKKADGNMDIALERTKDILGWLGSHRRPGQFLCGFSMETRDLLANSRAKLEKKNADMIVANSLKTEGAGFGTDTNLVTLITKEGQTELPKMTKEKVADRLLDEIRNRLDFGL